MIAPMAAGLVSTWVKNGRNDCGGVMRPKPPAIQTRAAHDPAEIKSSISAGRWLSVCRRKQHLEGPALSHERLGQVRPQVGPLVLQLGQASLCNEHYGLQPHASVAPMRCFDQIQQLPSCRGALGALEVEPEGGLGPPAAKQSEAITVR